MATPADGPSLGSRSWKSSCVAGTRATGSLYCIAPIAKFIWQCHSLARPACVPVAFNRRAEVLSHSLTEKLPEGDHRHLVVTLPKKMGLRKRFQLDTRLHRQIGRVVHRVLTRWMARQVGCHRNRREERDQAKPRIIIAVQSAERIAALHSQVSGGPQMPAARERETPGILASGPLWILGLCGRPHQPARRPTSPAASAELHTPETLRRTCEP